MRHAGFASCLIDRRGIAPLALAVVTALVTHVPTVAQGGTLAFVGEYRVRIQNQNPPQVFVEADVEVADGLHRGVRTAGAK